MPRPSTLAIALSMLLTPAALAQDQWLTFEGREGPGHGKHIVLISGDEEYRSEEALPMLGKLLARRHGFKCTVLFPIDPKTGEINPKHTSNIPGLEALDSADLMIIATRFRNLPEEQMKHIEDFLNAGKPVIGLRTATHAFNGLKGPYEKYNNGYKGTEKEWADGFGRLVLGEKWISHHGGHKTESTRGVFAHDAKGHPILSGINDGEIWGATDVYGVRLPLPGDAKPLVLGQILARKGAPKKPAEDPNFGLSPEDQPKTGDKRNEPMMPIAWTKSYQLPGGKAGKSFTTTMGSSTDFTNEPFRRLVVNAVFHLLDLKVPQKADVTPVGDYKPTAYGFDGHAKGKKPSDLK